MKCLCVTDFKIWQGHHRRRCGWWVHSVFISSSLDIPPQNRLWRELTSSIFVFLSFSDGHKKQQGYREIEYFHWNTCGTEAYSCWTEACRWCAFEVKTCRQSLMKTCESKLHANSNTAEIIPLSFGGFLLQLKPELSANSWAEAYSFVNEASNYLLPRSNMANWISLSSVHLSVCRGSQEEDCGSKG